MIEVQSVWLFSENGTGWMALSGVQALAKVIWKMFCEKQVQSWMVEGQQIWQKPKETAKGIGATGQCPGDEAE